MEAAFRDRRTLPRIAATLLALALIAERAASRSFPVRFLVLSILWRAEAVARAFVAEASEADWPWPYEPLHEPRPMRGGAADANILALRLRMLAAVLGVLSGAAGCSTARSAAQAPGPGGAACRANPVLLLVFPACRRRSCRSPPSWGRWPAGQRGALSRRRRVPSRPPLSASPTSPPHGRRAIAYEIRKACFVGSTPTPNPSPQGGGGS